jgi:integrase
VKDKAYRAYPLGGEWAAFMRWGRGRWTKSTYRDYESTGDKLAREFPDLELRDFEPPVGTERLEEFLDKLWGEAAPRTYNKHVTILQQFFKFAVLKGKLHGDPSLPLMRHKKRDVHREVFAEDTILQIVTAGPDAEDLPRDRVALILLLVYAIRKGALRAIQFKHFDHQRRILTLFSKGEKIRPLRIPDADFWLDLERVILEREAQPEHYLMCARRQIWRGYNEDGSSRFERKQYPEKQMGEHGLHDWWYGCLARAGIVTEGTTRGEKMHKARHSAGQALLEETHDIKLVQKLLGHADPATTMQHYVDYDEFQLADHMIRMLERRKGQ